MKIIAIIPSYNEDQRILQDVINKTKKYVKQILVINDGSKEKLKVKDCKILTNNKNMGKGATLIRGFNYAINNKFEVVITLDADGEHNPEEIPKFLDKIDNYDFVIGQRTYYRTLERKMVNGRDCHSSDATEMVAFFGRTSLVSARRVRKSRSHRRS